MSIKYDYKLSLILAGRAFASKDEESLYLKDIEFWKQSLSFINHRNYSLNNTLIAIECNWKPKIVRLRSQLKEYREYKLGIEKVWKQKSPVNINFSVEISDSKEKYYYGRYFIEHFIHEVFLLMNLAWPGVCDFHNLHLDNNINKNRTEISLSSLNLELSWLNSEDNLFPKIDEISLETVVNWYEKIDFGIKQKATNPIQKVLFSLLHICRDGEDVTTVIWIFHALEALFSTKVGESFNNLVDRISFLLEIDLKEKSILKRKLRFLYNLRSSLVHGGYAIYHPSRNDIFDKAINDQFMEMYENIAFGVAVITASLQKLIKNSWCGINVDQKIIGKEFPNN